MVTPRSDQVCGARVLRVCRGLLEVLERLADECASEVAGFLLGRLGGEELVTEVAVFGCNVEGDPVTGFRVDGESTYRAVRLAEERGLYVIGVFHTHPCYGSRPSGRDVDGMRMWPVVWVIASHDGVRAWRLCGYLVEEVELEPVSAECGVVMPLSCPPCRE